MKKFFTTIAMCGTMLSPLASTAARADTILDTVTAAEPSSATLALMEGQCDLLASAHGTAWSGEVDQDSIAATYVSGPTEIASTRDVDESTIVGTGTFIPGHTYIQGQPFRIGGSVNMFGDQYADSGSWPSSMYDYDADFSSVYSYAFNCAMSESVYHQAAGHYVVEPEDQGLEEESQKSCDAFNAMGPDPSQPWWGTDHAQCDFVETTPAGYVDEDRDAEPGTPVNQTQTDRLTAHEDEGGPVNAPGGIYHIGQVVVCISPKKPTPGGTWATHNGYTGSNCTTTYFKTAPWGSGTESSNGTYISVPNYNL